MASDHRGRELHAGKRTAQEMGWDNTFTSDSDGMFQAHKSTDPWRGSGHPMGNLSVWRNTGGEDTSWMVTKHNSEALGVENIPPSGTDLGRGKVAETLARSRVVRGTASTPTRAVIAAEAMKKRIEEGRDLKTGRPKK